MVQAKKVFAAFVLVGALVLSLCPITANSAYAYELSAAKTKVTVIDTYGGVKYSYNSNGFLSKKTGTSYDMSTTTTTYKYSGAKILSSKSNGAYNPNIKATYKNGRIAKVAYKWKGIPLITDTYKYKKGRVSQATRKNAGNSLVKYAYNSKGRISKVTEYFKISKTKTSKYVESYTYDSKGHVTKVKQTESGKTTTLKYKNTYKNGLLVQQQLVSWGGSEPVDITYKTISVPKKYAAKVKAQQKKIFDYYGKDQDPLFF